MSIVEVEIPSLHCVGFFSNDFVNVKKKLTVIVDTDKGLQFGNVINIIEDVSSFDGVTLGNVVRISTKKDYLHHLDNIKLADEAIKKCRDIVLRDSLNMTILDSNYSFDRSQLLFRFLSDERVDFRNLAKELGSLFRTRIELRQIGIRDKAKEVGGIGPCGRSLCCSSFLKNFDSVTINMAKNQNVSLNPTKINGVCGRLLCCLKYENDTYSSLKKDMPKIGTNVDSEYGNGKVISVDVLRNSYVIELDNKNKVEVFCNESKK